MDLTACFYDPGDSVVCVGSLMYHAIMNRMPRREIQKLDSSVTVKSFLKFVSSTPDGSRGQLFDDDTTVAAQIAMEELVKKEGGEAEAAVLITQLASTYLTEGILDTEGPGHMTTDDRNGELRKIVEGRTVSSPFFCQAAVLVFSQMRASTPMSTIQGAVNAFNRLQGSGIIRKFIYIGA